MVQGDHVSPAEGLATCVRTSSLESGKAMDSVPAPHLESLNALAYNPNGDTVLKPPSAFSPQDPTDASGNLIPDVWGELDSMSPGLDSLAALDVARQTGSAVVQKPVTVGTVGTSLAAQSKNSGPVNQKQGDFYSLLQVTRLSDLECFFNILRVTPEIFDNLLSLVSPLIHKKSVGREALPVGLRLGVTLRWRIFRKPIVASVGTVESIIKACVCLHNLMTEISSTKYMPKYYADCDGDAQDGAWRKEPTAAMQPVGQVGCNNHSQEAFTEFFSGVGQVEWQWQKLRGGRDLYTDRVYSSRHCLLSVTDGAWLNVGACADWFFYADFQGEARPKLKLFLQMQNFVRRSR
uniref:DDE Tnp4 domain-containing protein n=1 Tax=Timema poppense TaxID=170557 RepID=A0A7R9CTV0_TIMPO|nr:unnamed protein product [Timema poppensis]